MEKENFKNILTSRIKLQNFLKENNLYLKKRFGQNFLFDKNIIHKILNNIYLKKKDVIEIGSGIGNLTLFYHHLPKHIYLIEIDKGFYRILQDLFLNNTHISILHSNFLKFDLSKIIKQNQKYIFLSNLPYNSGSQILVKLLDYYENIEEIYIMAPEIYYEKFMPPKQQFNNRLGLLLNLFFKIEKLFKVSRNCFYPFPEIDSVFMKLIPEKKIEDPERTKKILALLFKQKRKKLKKVLEKSDKEKILSPFYNKRIDGITLKEVIYIINNLIL